MAELDRLRDQFDELDSAGIVVRVISVEPSMLAQAGARKHALPFPVLVDEGMNLVDALGLRHAGGGHGADTAFATSFLVDANGIVKWRFAPDNFRLRAEPSEVIEAAQKL